MFVFVAAATMLILLPTTLRRRLMGRLNAWLRHRCRSWLRRRRAEFLNRWAGWLSPLLRHRRRGRSPEFLDRRARRFGTLRRHLAHRRWHLTFHALNILHLPTRLPFLRRHHWPGLAFLGADFRHRRVATHWRWRRFRRARTHLGIRATEVILPLHRCGIGWPNSAGIRCWLTQLRGRRVTMLRHDRGRYDFNRAPSVFNALAHFTISGAARFRHRLPESRAIRGSLHRFGARRAMLRAVLPRCIEIPTLAIW